MQNCKKYKENTVRMGVFLRRYATRLAFLCAFAAFILFIIAALTASSGLRIFLIVTIVLLLLSGAILLFFGSRQNAGKIHYFLYDRRRGRFYRQEELTPEIIQDAMSYYLRDFVKEEIELWEDIPKPLRLQLEGEPQFRPLVMYRMLFLLSAQTPEAALSVFGETSEQIVIYLCRSITESGDRELADYIYHLKKNYQNEQERIGPFFTKNKRTFAARILRYTERHFDEFYVTRSRLGK